MRLSLKTLIGIAIALPVMVLISSSSYYLYKNFTEYHEFENSKQYIKLAEKLEKILIALGEERGSTSIYFISQGKYPRSAKLVREKRQKMNEAINELKKFITKHPQLYASVKEVFKYINQLTIIRRKIDTFKEIKYKEWFFGYYTKLENTIIKILSEIKSRFPKTLKTVYEEKIPLEKMTAYTGVIRGFGAYYITADLPMSKNDYENVLMKYYHDLNILPTKLLHENEDVKKIEKDIKEILFYVQQANMNYYINGEFDGYPVDAVDYFNEMTKRIHFLYGIINKLNQKVANYIIVKEREVKSNLIIQSIIMIISIITLLLGIYIFRKMANHINELSHLISQLSPLVGETLKIDISSPEGMHRAVEIISHTIATTQEAVRRSEEATKAKSLFLANMSHEIRTPLNGILGFLELLKTTPINDEQAEYIATIEQSAKNLLQIVNNILDVSKIESNKVTLELIDFKALDEFENTVEIFATPAAQKQIEYVTEISPNMPSVLKGDILKIKEILTNLINNAIKFTHKDGLISVKIKFLGIVDKKARLYFEVKDTGIGMSEEQKNKIFEAFTQADESVTRKYGGTGLGLTIVKSYIEMMGGEIQVESELNKGTKFFFEIELDVVDPTPRYKENSLKNLTFAILNTSVDSLRKEVTNNYISYFGINKIGFNNARELNTLNKSEKINAVLIFYQESNKDVVEDVIDSSPLPVITVSSYAFKDLIDKLSPDFTLYDPVTPSKTYTTTTNIVKAKKPSTSAATIRAHRVEVEETPLSKLKVLIAEDNPINMQLLKTTLKNMGIEADTATNGLEAFNKYTMNPDKYDVIFMDAQMPIMDGIEATQEILEFEKEEGIKHTPIIAVTANVLKGDRERFLGAGMDDYISKPISMDKLKEILHKIAQHKYDRIETIDETEIPTSSTQTQQSQQTQEVKKETKTETEKTNVIVASESEFLVDYLKTIAHGDFIPATTLKELESKISPNENNIVLIEEDFEGLDVEKLIEFIKSKFKNVKIFVITDREIPTADGIIKKLNSETINQILKGAKWVRKY